MIICVLSQLYSQKHKKDKEKCDLAAEQLSSWISFKQMDFKCVHSEESNKEFILIKLISFSQFGV